MCHFEHANSLLPREKGLGIMVTEHEASADSLMPQRPPVNVIRSSKDEEGPVKGELWAVLRALGVLVGVIMLIGFLIA